MSKNPPERINLVWRAAELFDAKAVTVIGPNEPIVPELQDVIATWAAAAKDHRLSNYQPRDLIGWDPSGLPIYSDSLILSQLGKSTQSSPQDRPAPSEPDFEI